MTLGRQTSLQAAGVSAVVGLAVTGIWMAERVDKFAVRRFFQSLSGGGSEKGRKGRSKQQPKAGGQSGGGWPPSTHIMQRDSVYSIFVFEFSNRPIAIPAL